MCSEQILQLASTALAKLNVRAELGAVFFGVVDTRIRFAPVCEIDESPLTELPLRLSLGKQHGVLISLY